MKLISGKRFIVFGEDFGRHPHALEHLLRPLFNDNEFIWVETIGLRSPKLNGYDLKRIYEKLKSWTRPAQEKRKVPLSVHIVSPFMIPFNKYSLIRKFNAWSVKRTIQKKLQDFDTQKELISIASVPQACDHIGHYQEKCKIYFCVDEFSLWPGMDLSLVKILEDKLIQKADLICATAENLCRSKRKSGQQTLLITHGVDFEHFFLAQESTAIKDICYFGLFDERSDQELLLKVAEAHPDLNLHIVGPVVTATASLKKENIHFHGRVNYAELPAKIASMDLFLLPYKNNELTHFINPLKLKEYMSTGRPVVSTPLPEIMKLKDHLFVGENHKEFVDLIGKLKSRELSHDREKVLAYVKNHETWTMKAKLLSDLIEQQA